MIENREFDSHSLRHLPDFVRQTTISRLGFARPTGREMKTKSHETTADLAAYRAIDQIYHSYLTGLILMLSSRAGPQRSADIAFRTFRR
jgi:hypothetical protein